MELDRSPRGFLDVTVQAAVRRCRESAGEARRLLEGGFPGPAYVWAVRSVEVFVKEVMLLRVFSKRSRANPTSSSGCGRRHGGGSGTAS
jgi:hypothetical protein